jgi:DNA-binding response OmpR family regulator
MANLLIIDDSIDTQLLLKKTLSKNHQVFIHDGNPGVINYIKRTMPDLIILDINFPNTTGFEILNEIRTHQELTSTPILFLSSNKSIESKLKSFELGGVDYVEKPFHPEELLVRVEARLKRDPRIHAIKITKGVFTLNLENQKLTIEENNHQQTKIELTGIEFKLLKFFMQNTNQILTRAMILDKIWSDDIHVSNRTVDVHLSTIRKKHPHLKKALKSVYGEGYRFQYDAIITAPSFSANQ